ncbi:unnamed protein product [Schistosoma margrebowiei]|uniref:Uncharacterized protein n=1 Tax=Schistosoma margrebowiei TaxID=48269 RepID=A0A183MUW1_9TREM|nr:unnamed protein product [Schistosoma margrebowiei]
MAIRQIMSGKAAGPDNIPAEALKADEKTTGVVTASTAVGLNIHKGKSKILRYNTACTNQITLGEEALEDVEIFTYLGSIIDEHGGCNADVKVRNGKARAAYLELKYIWDSKQLSTNTKVRIFNTCVKTGRGRPKNTLRREMETDMRRMIKNWMGLERKTEDRVGLRMLVRGLCRIGSNRRK